MLVSEELLKTALSCLEQMKLYHPDDLEAYDHQVHQFCQTAELHLDPTSQFLQNQYSGACSISPDVQCFCDSKLPLLTAPCPRFLFVVSQCKGKDCMLSTI